MAVSNMIKVCSLGSGEEVMRFKVNKNPDKDEYVSDVLFTPDSNFLIVATDCKGVMVCYHASTLWLHTQVGRRFCLR